MRERLLISFFVAILIHFVLLLVLQLALKIERSRPPEYSGPLYVSLEDVPLEAPVLDKAQEPQQLPRVERETPRVEQPPATQPRPQRTRPAAEPTQLPQFRPAPPTETTQPATERPRTGLRELPPSTPRSDEPYLPPDQQAFQPPPAQTESSRQPVPAREVPSIQQAEVRPQTEPEQPSLLDLRRLDSSISQPGTSPAAAGGTREGAPATAPSTGSLSTSAQEGREGIVILWDEPSQGRETTSTPKPVVPDWVSRQGLTLQVVVSFGLTPQGLLQDLKLEKGSGYSEVDTAVLEALRRWKFKAVSTTARNITGRVTYTITAR